MERALICWFTSLLSTVAKVGAGVSWRPHGQQHLNHMGTTSLHSLHFGCSDDVASFMLNAQITLTKPLMTRRGDCRLQERCLNFTEFCEMLQCSLIFPPDTGRCTTSYRSEITSLLTLSSCPAVQKMQRPSIRLPGCQGCDLQAGFSYIENWHPGGCLSSLKTE